MAEKKKAAPKKKAPAKKKTAKKAPAKKKTATKKSPAKKKAATKKAPAKKAAAGDAPVKAAEKPKVETAAPPKEKPVPKKAGRLRITQVKSPIGSPRPQKATLVALGLRRMNHTVEHEDNPVIRGMIGAVRHLVRVEEAR